MAESVLTEYAPVLITAVLAFVIVWATLSVTKLVAPKRLTPAKQSTYESGEVPLGSSRGPFDVQYYLYVLVFLIIDVEAAFLIPFALNYADIRLDTSHLVAAGIFVFLILDGWVYAWKKGALDWQS